VCIHRFFAVVFEQKVVWFQIAMRDFLRVHVVDPVDNLPENLLRRPFRE
jgi:hypothetical protein